MLCTNCNRVIPDGSETCIYCKAKIDLTKRRCPDCWASLKKDETLCPKCGCDIETRIKEIHDAENEKELTFFDKFRKIPLWLRFVVPALVLIVALLFGIYTANEERERKHEAALLASDYVVSVEIAMTDITKIAYAYEDMVYGQSWLDHLGSAEAVRKVYSDEISVAKKAREPINYARNRIDRLGNAEISELVGEVQYNYVQCYSYVIGEQGKYPKYIQGYKKILSDYEQSVEALKEAVQKYN